VGLAGLLGDYGDDSDGDNEALVEGKSVLLPARPRIALPPPSSLDLPDWAAALQSKVVEEPGERRKGGAGVVGTGTGVGLGEGASRLEATGGVGAGPGGVPAVQVTRGKGDGEVCRNWLQGRCDRGADCRFLHASDKGSGGRGEGAGAGRRGRRGGRGRNTSK
jgi:hypothetical protein